MRRRTEKEEFTVAVIFVEKRKEEVETCTLDLSSKMVELIIDKIGEIERRVDVQKKSDEINGFEFKKKAGIEKEEVAVAVIFVEKSKGEMEACILDLPMMTRWGRKKNS